MQSMQARRRWLQAARITPLTLVILGSLTWSSYATFEYAVAQSVPAFIAWTLPLALDGTVAVTTPIWLSTVLPKQERNYAAWICTFALLASMVVNAAESNWVGVFPPLIAYLLIHLLARVFLAERARDTQPGTPIAPVVVERDVVVVPEPVEAIEPPPVAESVAEALVASTEPVTVAQEPVPATLTVLPRRYASASELARDLLDQARGELGGADLTRKVREAGWTVNDNFGRSMKARWSEKQRKEVAV